MTADPLSLLRGVPLFAGLADTALAALAGGLRRRAFRRGTILFHKDQPGDALYIVASGRVRIFVPGGEGEELTLDVAGEGEVFGELALLDGGPRSATAEAQEDLVVYTLTRSDFGRMLAADPSLATRVIELLAGRLRHVTEYAESLAFLDVQARLARALLEMAARYGVERDGLEIDVGLSQTDLATMVGATRERVNRALAVFRAQGMVELRGRAIVLRDVARLRQRLA